LDAALPVYAVLQLFVERIATVVAVGEEHVVLSRFDIAAANHRDLLWVPVTSPPPISLWTTGHLSEVFRPREVKISYFTWH
jgi:hypothetical protein